MTKLPELFIKKEFIVRQIAAMFSLALRKAYYSCKTNDVGSNEIAVDYGNEDACRILVSNVEIWKACTFTTFQHYGGDTLNEQIHKLLWLQ